jgi:hypothetical protein
LVLVEQVTQMLEELAQMVLILFFLQLLLQVVEAEEVSAAQAQTAEQVVVLVSATHLMVLEPLIKVLMEEMAQRLALV